MSSDKLAFLMGADWQVGDRETFAELERVARRRRFVGRADTLAWFAAWLESREVPGTRVLFVHGPGGVGKTTLLQEQRDLCDELQRPTLHLDARAVGPLPDEVCAALCAELAEESAETRATKEVAELLADLQQRRLVLFFDTFERLEALQGWFRGCFLNRLPSEIRVVVASRRPPPTAWLADAGFRALLKTVELGNFSPEEGRALLRRSAIPARHHEAVLAATRGHPLAMSLVEATFAADGDEDFSFEKRPDVVAELVACFVRQVPSPRHRRALQACAVARVANESLLGAMLGSPDVGDLFDWLRDQSFVQTSPQGVFPHDVVRDALLADFRWRDPERHEAFLGRAVMFAAARLRGAGPELHRRLILDLAFLARNHPIVEQFAALPVEDTVFVDRFALADADAASAIVERHEGPQSARLARWWQRRQPTSAWVVRRQQGGVQGYLQFVALHEVDDRDRTQDVVVDRVCRYVWERVRPPREAAVLLGRFLADADVYQGVSYSRMLLTVAQVRHELRTPGLAFSCHVTADPELWEPLLQQVGFGRLAGCDFEHAGRTYAIFGHDWLDVPSWRWMCQSATDVLGLQSTAARRPLEGLPTLTYEEFKAAVKRALKDLTQPDRLQGSALLHARLVNDRVAEGASAGERAKALAEVIAEGCRGFNRSPRDRVLCRVMERTYLRPEGKQLAVAAKLGLPFGSYRRHLGNAIQRLTDLLWRLETDEGQGAIAAQERPGGDVVAGAPGSDGAAGAPGSDGAAGAPGSDGAAGAPGSDGAAGAATGHHAPD